MIVLSKIFVEQAISPKSISSYTIAAQLMVDVQPAGSIGNSDGCKASAAETVNSDDHAASMDKESMGGIVIDLNSNHEEDGKEDTRSENEHENGTEETAEMVDEKHLDENEDLKTGTPEPVVSFDSEPADRVPEPGFHTTISNYCLSDSENDSLAMLKRPDFQMPIQRKPQRKGRSSRRESDRQNEQTNGSRRQHQSKMRYKEPCKCQEIRKDPKLKTKVCIIL
ncbi:hypothetical protein GCK32_002507 [Trichostrongylus colubriformis]|uniref:Uncharacterized protein n=1 Tax=Trichostrongylus colubriformis TaxID=6319 RepID=A0AAN8G5V9_TRICO